MGKPSTAVKRRYNDKTYKRWFADLRYEDFDRIEALRGELSRAAFLKKMLALYEANASGDIPAQKIGNQWVIQADALPPPDKRVKSGKYKNWRKPAPEKPEE